MKSDRSGILVLKDGIWGAMALSRATKALYSLLHRHKTFEVALSDTDSTTTGVSFLRATPSEEATSTRIVDNSVGLTYRVIGSGASAGGGSDGVVGAAAAPIDADLDMDTAPRVLSSEDTTEAMLFLERRRGSRDGDFSGTRNESSLSVSDLVLRCVLLLSRSSSNEKPLGSLADETAGKG